MRIASSLPASPAIEAAVPKTAQPAAPALPPFEQLKMKLAPLGLELMVARRMQAYGNPFIASFRGADQLFDAMEQNTKKDPMALLTVFEATLLRLLDDPTVLAFITELEAANDGVDVWRLAVDRFGGERRALAVLAPLFQDTSGMGAHIMRISMKPELAKYHPAALRVGALCSRFASQASALIPPQFRDTPDVRAYHFLVMAEAAARLREGGFDARVAASAPYALNTAYEIYQKRFAGQGGGDGVSAVMQKPWLAALDLIAPRDPDIFDVSDASALSDVYLGYAGSGYGAGLQSSLLSYQAFASRYADAPQKTSKNAFR